MGFPYRMRCGMRYGCLSQKYYRLPVQNAVRNAILMFLPTHIQEVMHGSARGAMAMATAMKCKDEDDDFLGLLCGHFGLLLLQYGEQMSGISTTI